MSPIALAVVSASLGLMYFAGARMFSNSRYGIVTAALFALTPLLWTQSQYAPSSLAPLPLVAGWLVAIAHFQHDRRPWWPVAAGSLLGLGVYTSNAAAVMMPLYLVLTLAVLAHDRALSPRQLGFVTAAFCVAVAPFAISMIRHPEVFRQTVNTHHLYDADRFSIRQGIREMASWLGLTARTEVYYDYFNPAFLFLTGRVLLFPMALLIPLGVYQIVTGERSTALRLALASFFAAPFAAALTAQPPTPARILFIMPFAALVSACGLRFVLAWPFSFSAGSSPPVRSSRP